jgi:hypothetical protein
VIAILLDLFCAICGFVKANDHVPMLASMTCATIHLQEDALEVEESMEEILATVKAAT